MADPNERDTLNAPRAPSLARVEAIEVPKAPGEAGHGPLALASDTLKRNAWGAVTPTGRTQAEELSARVARRVRGEELPVTTPWKNLNVAMGHGLWPGLHVLVGSTGTGKSQFAMQLAVEAARTGFPVMYLALELDALGLFARAAALTCHHRLADPNGQPLRVSWSDFYTGRAEVPAWCAEELTALPLHWMEAPPHGFAYDGITPHVAALRSLYPQHKGPVVVVVDFLQLMSGDAREDLRERVGRASYQCRAAAREYDAVVIALSSTSREGHKVARIRPARDGGERDDADDPTPRRPPLADLVGLGKESSDVEYSADSVLTFCPEPWPDGVAPPEGGKRIHVAVAKLRAGSPSWCVLAFDGTRFTSVEDFRDDATIPAEPNRRGRGKGGRGNGRGSDRYGRGRGSDFEAPVDLELKDDEVDP
jgi:replicative DNA helicase